MKRFKPGSLVIIIFMACASSGASVYAQKAGEQFVCRQEVFARLQPLPKLSYECRPDAANDYDESILKWTEGIWAIKD